VLQSKNVKFVATKSGPFSTRTESLDVKWLSLLGMRGRRSFLGVVHATPAVSIGHQNLAKS